MHLLAWRTFFLLTATFSALFHSFFCVKQKKVRFASEIINMPPNHDAKFDAFFRQFTLAIVENEFVVHFQKTSKTKAREDLVPLRELDVLRELEEWKPLKQLLLGAFTKKTELLLVFVTRKASFTPFDLNENPPLTLHSSVRQAFPAMFCGAEERFYAQVEKAANQPDFGKRTREFFASFAMLATDVALNALPLCYMKTTTQNPTKLKSILKRQSPLVKKQISWLKVCFYAASALSFVGASVGVIICLVRRRRANSLL